MACKRSAVRTRYSPLCRLSGIDQMFFTYIIFSGNLNRYYVGSTRNLQDRLHRHNNSGSKSTKKASDWVIVFSEIFSTRSEALHREMEIKRKKSRKYIESLIKDY